jgi:hypothetical protein
MASVGKILGAATPSNQLDQASQVSIGRFIDYIEMCFAPAIGDGDLLYHHMS